MKLNKKALVLLFENILNVTSGNSDDFMDSDLVIESLKVLENEIKEILKNEPH